MDSPEDEIAAGAGRDSHLRVSHADRDQVIDVLKAAFVQGRLTKDELEARVGQAFAVPTRAELAAVTAHIPVGPDLVQPPKPAGGQPQRPRNRAANRAVKSGVCAITAVMVAANGLAVAVGQPVAAVILTLFSHPPGSEVCSSHRTGSWPCRVTEHPVSRSDFIPSVGWNASR